MLQSEALQILKMGKNVFLTGSAGSGKTHVLNSYISFLKSNAVDVAVTASTGIAATHLGGQTIHSWTGLGVKDFLTDYDIESLMQKQYLYKRFDRTKVLVIDEISMLHHYRLDMIEWICRRMKRSEKPFGGMQIIVCGDFFQLPPVTRGDVLESEFAYKADSWLSSQFVVCYLSEQHRQKDNSYLSILNEIRSGSVSEKTVGNLKSRLNKDLQEGRSQGKEFTRLYTHNVDVDQINKKYLSLLEPKSHFYEMSSRGASSLVETIKKSCLSPETLELKVGARVMFTKNHPEGLYVNGTLGVVEEYDSFGMPVVQTNHGLKINVSEQSWKIEEEGKVKAEVSQLPLRLAWAITVHKSQGMSLDSMEVDLSKSFVKGMGYVALSRVRSLDGMKLLGFNEMSLLVDDEVLKMDEKFKEESIKNVQKLKDLSSEEIAEAQREWMKKIEPEEKIKIRKKEKEVYKEEKISSDEITKTFLENEVSLKEIAEARGVKQETIVSHIENLKEKNICPDILYLKRELKRSELEEILTAFEEVKSTTLSSVFNYLMKKKKKPSYLKIRLARLFLD